MKKKTLLYTVLSALFAALTALLTFFPKIPIPGGGGGYVHLGDSVIYIAASLLPLPFAAAAGAVGGAAADILSGAAVWAPWTVAVKILLTLSFTKRKDSLLCKRNIIAAAAGIVITAGGYFAAESVIYSVPLAAASVVWNLAQGAASAAVYVILAGALDRTGVKKKLLKGRVR